MNSVYTLTQKQRELLSFLQERVEEGGVAPSYDEMRLALGLASKSGIHRLVGGLEERGYISRLPHRSRAIRLVWSQEVPSDD